jgi:hypothetical protein
MLPPLRTLSYYEPLEPTRHHALMKALSGGELRTVGNMRNIPPLPHRRLFDWSSVRLVFTGQPVPDPEGEGWEESERLSNGLRVYLNRRVVPRASLWETYRVVNAQTALEELTAGGPPDRGQGVALEDEPSRAWQEQRALSPPPNGSAEVGTVAFLADEPERVVLRVTASRPALLVLSDTYLAGWCCAVDGAPVPVLRANYLYRAVAVPGGEHVVEFRYRPRGLSAGVVVTAFGLLLLAAVGFGGRVGRRWMKSTFTSGETCPHPACD